MMTLMKKKQETGEKAAAAKASRPSLPGAEPGNGGPEGRDRPPEVKRKILVVGKGPVFTEGVMDYAASLAERLGYDIIAMNLNPASGPGGEVLLPVQPDHAGQVRPAGPDRLGSHGAGLNSPGDQVRACGEV